MPSIKCQQSLLLLGAARNNLFYVSPLVSAAWPVLLGSEKHSPNLPLYFTWWSPCGHICFQISPFHKDTTCIGLEPFLITSS